MLLNMADGEVQLLDIETAEITRRFLGQKQSQFVIRSAFGGADENLIISGSEGTMSPLLAPFSSTTPPQCILSSNWLITGYRLQGLYLAQGKRDFD